MAVQPLACLKWRFILLARMYPVSEKLRLRDLEPHLETLVERALKRLYVGSDVEGHSFLLHF